MFWLQSDPSFSHAASPTAPWSGNGQPDVHVQPADHDIVAIKPRELNVLEEVKEPAADGAHFSTVQVDGSNGSGNVEGVGAW